MPPPAPVTVRRDSGLRKRIAQNIHVHFRDVGIWLNDERRLHHQLRIRVMDHGHGRHKLLVRKLRQFSFAGRRRRTIATATAAAHRIFLRTVACTAPDPGAINWICSCTAFCTALFVPMRNSKPQHSKMNHHGGDAGPFFLPAVKAPDFFHRDRLGSDLQRRQLGRIYELLEVFPEGPIERLFVGR